MANLVQTKVSLTERQTAFLRSEARRRDVTEGEVIRGWLDFCIDVTKGDAALCAAALASPLGKKSSA